MTGLLLIVGQRITFQALSTSGRYTSIEIYPQPNDDKLLDIITILQFSFLIL